MGGCQEGNGQRISRGGKKKRRQIREVKGKERSGEDSDPDTKVYGGKNVLGPEEKTTGGI